MKLSLGLLFIAIFICLFMPAFSSTEAPSAIFEHSEGTVLSAWHDTRDLLSNAYFSWRYDDLTSRLSSSSSSLLTLLSIILAWGSYGFLCLKYSSKKNLVLHLVLALLTPLTIVVLYGNNPPIFSFLLWIPWLAASFVLIQREKVASSIGIPLSLFISYLVAHSANQMAIYAVATAVVVGTLNEAKKWSRELKVAITLSLLLSLLTIYRAPPPHPPSYPVNVGAHVVPDDGIPGEISPLVGWSPPIRLVDRHAIRSAFSAPALSLVLLISLAISLAVYLLKTRFEDLAFLAIPLTLLILVALDTVPPESWSLIAPLASLQRMISGWYTLPVTGFVFASAVLLIIFSTAASSNLKHVGQYPALLLISSLLVFVFKCGKTPFLFNTPNSTLQIQAALALQKLSIETPNSPARSLLLSPSFPVVAQYGPKVVAFVNQASSMIHKLSLDQSLATLNSSANVDQLKKALDGRMHSRWALSGNGQTGENEWLAIRLTIPQEIAGIELNTGKFPTDYPRGVKVTTLEKCDSQMEKSSFRNGHVAFDVNPWQGPVNFTELGVPYYGEQGDVRIRFSEPLMTECILIEQTGTESVYDWSVAELALLITR